MEKKPLFRGDSAAALLLCAVFLFLSMGFVMLGGSVYHKGTEAAKANDALRTTLSYFSNQIRRADAADAIEIGEFGDGDAIFLYQSLEGVDCVTYLYCYEGELKELFMEAGTTDIGPEAGQTILSLEGMSLEVVNHTLELEATLENGQKGKLLLVPRCGLSEVVAS